MAEEEKGLNVFFNCGVIAHPYYEVTMKDHGQFWYASIQAHGGRDEQVAVYTALTRERLEYSYGHFLSNVLKKIQLKLECVQKKG